MSWDVSILNVGKPYGSVAEMPKDSKLAPLGSCATVRSAASQHFPGIDWSDPSWGIYETESGSVEFNLRDEEPAMSLMLHVRAEQAVVSNILGMCAEQGWQALDVGSGDFLSDADVAQDRLGKWKEYARRVLSRRTNKKD